MTHVVPQVAARSFDHKHQWRQGHRVLRRAVRPGRHHKAASTPVTSPSRPAPRPAPSPALRYALCWCSQVAPEVAMLRARAQCQRNRVTTYCLGGSSPFNHGFCCLLQLTLEHAQVPSPRPANLYLLSDRGGTDGPYQVALKGKACAAGRWPDLLATIGTVAVAMCGRRARCLRIVGINRMRNGGRRRGSARDGGIW